MWQLLNVNRDKKIPQIEAVKYVPFRIVMLEGNMDRLIPPVFHEKIGVFVC